MEQNKPLTLGSLFDGSGGFPLGGIISGITPVWSSEIEPFPIRVTTKRLPSVKHYGDVSKLNGAELEPVDIITFKDMSPPTKELMKLVLEKKIAHGGHPVLRWNMDNIFIRTDPAGNIKADKEKSTEKIDGAIAAIMALDRAIRCGNKDIESIYDTRGILFI